MSGYSKLCRTIDDCLEGGDTYNAVDMIQKHISCYPQDYSKLYAKYSGLLEA